MKTFSKDIFEFGEAKIVYGDKGAGIRVIGGLGYENGRHVKSVWL